MDNDEETSGAGLANSLHGTIELSMMIEDNEVDIFIGKNLIQQTGFSNRMKIYDSAKKGLKYLRDYQYDIREIPEVIFLDMNMPIVSGFDFLDEFKTLNKEVQNKCALVILSSMDNIREMDEAMRHDNVIERFSKPLNESVLQRIQYILTTTSGPPYNSKWKF